MDWVNLIAPIISGIVAIVVTISKTKPSVKKEESNYTNVLFDQYKETIVVLRNDIVDRERRIRELQDEHDNELDILKRKINELENVIANQKQQLLDSEYIIKRLRLELKNYNVDIDDDINEKNRERRRME